MSTSKLAWIVAAMLSIGLAGCRDRGDDHGHDHDAHEHDHDHDHEHDHDHDHHDSHDHGAEDGRVVLTARGVESAGIRLEPVSRRELVETFVAPARVSFNPEAMAHVGSPVRGRVAQVQVSLGDAVKVGDVLMVIESPELGEAQSQYLERRIAVEAATPAVELARSGYERARALREQEQGIALTEVQKRELELRVAQSADATARAALASAEHRLLLMGMSEQEIARLSQGGKIDPRLSIRAPMDGQVVRRDVTLGELVHPDRDALMVLADPSTLWVLADVPETRLSGIAQGAPVTVTLPSLRQRALEGQVVYIASNLNPVTRTATVRVQVSGDTTGLRAGMFATAQIASGEGRTVMAVPRGAVQTIEGQTVVFVAASEPHTFDKRPVKVGPPVGSWVEVLEGLEEGEPVVVSGSFVLKAELGKAGAVHEH